MDMRVDEFVGLLLRVGCGSCHRGNPLLSNLRRSEEFINRGQQGALLIERQSLDLFHAADELDAGLFLRRLRALASPQQLIGGDFEDFGEAQDHIGVETQLVRFVVGNQTPE